jgi:hypothetical protein
MDDYLAENVIKTVGRLGGLMKVIEERLTV